MRRSSPPKKLCSKTLAIARETSRSRSDLEGDEPDPVFVILSGWACRYKILPGGSRQIILFLMPGDFCDMHVAVLAEMDHSITTLTEAQVATIPPDQIEAFVETRPQLAKAFWWTQLVDEGMLRATTEKGPNHETGAWIIIPLLTGEASPT